jgi:hypothetical protein
MIVLDYVLLLVSLIGRTYLWATSRGGEYPSEYVLSSNRTEYSELT